jgi:uncharacterized repeat protein (TIGR01451 family)
VQPISDLAISKTDGVTTAVSGAATTYTIVVTNNGPSAANNAVVTDPVATGLSKTAATCSGATAGAACPVSTTVALLQGAGVVIPSLPAGGTVSFTITATVTAPAGSVTNTVTVAPPAGNTDPTPGNDTASDTDTVQEAPSGMIAHTSTTCADYRDGTGTLDQINYSVSAGKVGNGINPGVFFYFAKITTTVANQIVTVTESHTGTAANFRTTGMGNLFTSTCGNSGISGDETADNTGFTWTVPAPGTYIIQIKYDTKSISGTPAPVPENIVYTFITNGLPSTSGSVPLIRE